MFIMFVAYHNVASVAKLVEFAKTALASDKVDLFIISKPQGSAAQTGVPEVHLLAYKLGKQLLVVRDLQQAIELLNPSKVIGIDREGSPLDVSKLDNRTLLVFPGVPSGFTKQEMELMEIYDVPPAGMSEIAKLGAVLHSLK